MANTVTTQTIVSSSKHLIYKWHIVGDGSGEETALKMVDVSTFSAPVPTEVRVVGIWASLHGFAARLLWDADTDVAMMSLPEGEDIFDFTKFGGLPNNAGTGKTGDIMISTIGLGSTDHGTIVLEMEKVY